MCGETLYRLVDQFYERVKSTWEERFERPYGFWRGCVDDVVLAFQARGDFGGGFARIYCDACRSESLVAFSCSRRVFCPSCAAKRSAIFGALLRGGILEQVGHAQWVFTVPKLLRPYFLYHRELLGQLSVGLGDGSRADRRDRGRRCAAWHDQRGADGDGPLGVEPTHTRSRFAWRLGS